MGKLVENKQPPSDKDQKAYESLILRLKTFRTKSDDVEKAFIREVMNAEQGTVWQYGGHGSFARFLDDCDICDPKRYANGKLALTELTEFTERVGILVAREVVRIHDAEKREIAMHDIQARTDHAGRPPSARTAQGIVNNLIGKKSSKTAPEWERENDELKQRIRMLESENKRLQSENTKLRERLTDSENTGGARQSTNKPKQAKHSAIRPS